MESDRLDQLLEFWGREQRDTILRCLRRVAEDAEASPWRSPTLSLPEVQEVMNPWEQPFHQELLYEYLDALDMWEVYALYITAKAGNPEFDLRSALKKPPTRMQTIRAFLDKAFPGKFARARRYFRALHIVLREEYPTLIKMFMTIMGTPVLVIALVSSVSNGSLGKIFKTFSSRWFGWGRR